MAMVRRTKPKHGTTERDFESFVAAVGDHLMRTAFLLTCDLSAAEDLYQKTLERLLQRWRSVEQPKAFCWRVMHNLVVDEGRARARRPREGPLHALVEPGDQASADSLGAAELRPCLLRALAGLSPSQRTVVVLRYFGDMSEAEIAHTMGVAPGTVKSTASRAMYLLRSDVSLAELFAGSAPDGSDITGRLFEFATASARPSSSERKLLHEI